MQSHPASFNLGSLACQLQLSITREVTRYMEPGHWFVSLYNDDGDVQELTFYAAIAEDMTQNCPNGCSGNGQCLLGHCQCNPGFGGDDCSESVCPVLCSQHGEYINGECICNPGWKGKECSLRHDECEVADCNGHGHCVSGKCQCMRGYKGKFCEEGRDRIAKLKIFPIPITFPIDKFNFINSYSCLKWTVPLQFVFISSLLLILIPFYL